MAQAKDRHYWDELRSVLVAGKWDVSTPGKTPNGIALSWSELLRKFRKHCGNPDVSEVASQTQALALLLGAKLPTLTAAALDGDCQSVNGPFDVGQDSILLPERKDEGVTSYKALKAVESSNQQMIRLTLAYHAYALDKPDECIELMSKLELPTSSLTATDDGEKSSLLPSSLMIEHAWKVTEWARGLCLKGMSQERLGDPSAALATYLSAAELIRPLEIKKSISSGSGKPDLDSFTRYRELWRWTEQLFWRAIVLSFRLRRPIPGARALLREYNGYSAHWPASFRTAHRSTLSCLHLHALVLSAKANAESETFDRRAWLAEGRRAISHYQDVLAISTSFPRAGEKNVKVEEFVDLTVAVWEASGATAEQSDWVIEVMWWATRFTFNCQKIFRHLTRLLHISGDDNLAKRTLRLYVQLVSRERQGNDGLPGAESDRVWMETLIQGARMLCRIPGGVEEAKEAGTLIAKAKEKIDSENKELVASLALAEGIWETVLALREQDPLTRLPHLDNALSSLTRSVSTNPTPSGHYHLALALARAGPNRNLPEAIINARAAVEGDAKEIPHWHLLGLVLAASGDWKAARAVLDIGAQIEEDLEAEAQQQRQQQTSAVTDPDPNEKVLTIRDFANGKGGDEKPAESDAASEVEEVYLLHENDTEFPPATSLLQPLPDHPPPSRRELFEQAVRLRMSQLALAEYIEGAENVGPKWADVFAWFAERRPADAQQHHHHQQQHAEARESGDGKTMRSVAVRSNAPAASHLEPTPELVREELNGSADESINTERDDGADTSIAPSELPVPITVTIASPPSSVQDHGPQIVGDSSHPDQRPIPIGSSNTPPDGLSIERGRTGTMSTMGSKKSHKTLKTRVTEGQKRISTISRKIGGNVRTSGGSLRRTTSAPDFHAVLSQPRPYQASSIHSRKRSWGARSHRDLPLAPSPPPPPVPPLQKANKASNRSPKERRLLSDLWLMSAATFRRVGKIEQTRAAIQEAEVLDEDNEAVWVQLGLYFEAMGNESQAIEAFHKALFISSDYVPAVVHLCRLYLAPVPAPLEDTPQNFPRRREEGEVDIAAGMLSDLTRGEGWDVPEAWHYLAKAMKAQGRRERERECLIFALGLVEGRGVREIGAALGACL